MCFLSIFIPIDRRKANTVGAGRQQNQAEDEKAAELAGYQ